MKRLLFTHGADIDGMGSAILSKLAFEQIDIIYARNVSDLDSKFKEEYESGRLYNYDIVYITDLSLKMDLANTVLKDEKLSSKIFVFDHHETALASGLNDFANCSIIVEKDGIKSCGTEIFYWYLVDNGYISKTKESLSTK